jgi:hypothetical protein
MHLVALIGMGLQAIVSLAVGLRLMALARRTRRFPELALGIETLMLPALGYPSLMVAVGLERLSMPGVAPVFFVGVSAAMVAASMNYLFTWRVFRPGAGWAALLCGVGIWLVFAPIGGIVAHVATSGIDQGLHESSLWTFPLVSSVLTAFGWTGGESFRYFLNAKRRMRLGLTEAPVCNRFLLWALASGAWFSLAALAGSLLLLGVSPLDSVLFTLCLGAAGLVNSVCMMLCFMPPESYLDWLRRRAAALPGA